ncbi:MAG TPA: tetraacyldisaccharide 4'-kinase [bacterium]|mgnify:CR=1 FL=1|nr:tetraacyldisaccharide 4'-kinase [bacterium]HPN44305.1 tetraacyldisaccharide 4'-kinase [bacterium]
MTFFENKWPALLLWPLSLLYSLVMIIRNLGYDAGVLPSFKVDCPVISVGNIVVGGTGKTPTVITLAQWFTAKQIRICIISRGYGRKSTGNVVVADGQKILAHVNESGDEALLLAKALPGVPVIVNKDRVQAARHALTHFQPHLILLDDGYQHRRLRRDVDIVAINSTKLFGNGFVLPAGPLREPLFNLKRADIVWINSNNEDDPQPELPRIVRNKPVVHALYMPTTLGNALGKLDLNVLRHNPVIAFSGLGNPVGFKNTLTSLGAEIKHFITFQDHHFYTDNDIQKLTTLSSNNNTRFVTTEKDWVKLPEEITHNPNWFYLAMHIKPVNPYDLDVIAGKINCLKIEQST